MNIFCFRIGGAAFCLSLVALACAQEDPSGNPADTEIWEPEPIVVTAGTGGAPPSDAIVLFDGSDLGQWQHRDGSDVQWSLEDGVVTVVPGTGDIVTRDAFGDMQLHVEWRTPAVVEGEGQGRGNSGIMIQQRYEVQVLDSYENRTYSNGQAASIYKQHIPLVNASRPPAEWQSYDIFFTAPRFAADGTLTTPAYVTVVHNGVLVQDHVEIAGPVRFIGAPYYQPHALRQPLQLQDHRNPVSFRNIWIREMWPGPASPHIALSEAGGESDWQWLFDGSSLDKWREFNKHGPVSPAWVVEAGVLAFRPERKTSPEPVDLITKEQFADFELELEWKISPGGNSGIFFHVTEHEGLVRASHTGLEMQILDDGYNPDAADPDETAGAAYDLYAPGRAMTRPVGEWNLVRIVSIGGRTEYWLNGEKIVEFDRDSEDWRQRYAASKFPSPGFEHFAMARRGHIGLQDHDDVVFFRNIRIRRL